MKNGQDCCVHRSVQKHGASKQKHPQHHSHAPASARSNIAERNTPRTAKACRQMEASNNAGSAALGMKKPTRLPPHARFLVFNIFTLTAKI
jgi:hypothetical protein